MKEHPILFSTPMVQAILEGRKTQTRRVVIPNPNQKEWLSSKLLCNAKSAEFLQGGAQFQHPSGGPLTFIKCPYGQPGYLLWVRETFEYLDRGTDDLGWEGYLRYVADEKEIRYPSQDCSPKRMPSIHMPKDAARIWLQIEEVKVERLQDISEEDAKAEGVNPSDKNISAEQRWLNYCNPSDAKGFSFKGGFEIIWHQINGIESWHENPWVWVVKFKVLSTTGKPEFN